MKKRAKKEKTDSVDIWPLAIVIASILLVVSLGFNIYYAISLSQDKSVISNNAANSKSTYEGEEEVDELDIREGEDPIEEEYVEDEDDEEDYEEMTNRERELMGIIEKKRQQLGQNDWKCASVYLDAKNADGTKNLVYYTARDEHGDEEEFITLMEYKNGDWQMKLPGYNMVDEFVYELYGLKMIQ